MSNESTLRPELESVVANVVDEVMALFSLEASTGTDVTFAINKAFHSLPPSLSVHAMTRVATARAKYQVAKNILSGFEAGNVNF